MISSQFNPDHILKPHFPKANYKNIHHITLWTQNDFSKTPFFYYIVCVGVRGGAVGWGTALQAGRSRVRFPMVSLEFIFP